MMKHHKHFLIVFAVILLCSLVASFMGCVQIETFETSSNIWMTHAPTLMSDQVISVYNSWVRLNPPPQYNVMYCSDQDCKEFMRTQFAGRQIVSTYDAAPVNVMRADIWRYAVTYVHSGLYTDADNMCAVPIKDWGIWPDAEFVVPLEAGHPFFCQWWFWARIKQHPVLAKVLHMIEERSKNGMPVSEHFVHYHTGPAIWSDAIKIHVKDHFPGVDTELGAQDFFKSYTAQFRQLKIQVITAENANQWTKHLFTGDQGWKADVKRLISQNQR